MSKYPDKKGKYVHLTFEFIYSLFDFMFMIKNWWYSLSFSQHENKRAKREKEELKRYQLTTVKLKTDLRWLKKFFLDIF